MNRAFMLLLSASCTLGTANTALAKAARGVSHHDKANPEAPPSPETPRDYPHDPCLTLEQQTQKAVKLLAPIPAMQVAFASTPWAVHRAACETFIAHCAEGHKPTCRDAMATWEASRNAAFQEAPVRPATAPWCRCWKQCKR